YVSRPRNGTMASHFRERGIPVPQYAFEFTQQQIVKLSISERRKMIAELKKLEPRHSTKHAMTVNAPENEQAALFGTLQLDN
ncbi:MAG: hypothetical protein KDA55_18950, partial [Planctomycetales bacterium]|nr:hypothetical protein [Planctomycetales bacterium]